MQDLIYDIMAQNMLLCYSGLKIVLCYWISINGCSNTFHFITLWTIVVFGFVWIFFRRLKTLVFFPGTQSSSGVQLKM